MRSVFFFAAISLSSGLVVAKDYRTLYYSDIDLLAISDLAQQAEEEPDAARLTEKVVQFLDSTAIEFSVEKERIERPRVDIQKLMDLMRTDPEVQRLRQAGDPKSGNEWLARIAELERQAQTPNTRPMDPREMTSREVARLSRPRFEQAVVRALAVFFTHAQGLGWHPGDEGRQAKVKPERLRACQAFARGTKLLALLTAGSDRVGLEPENNALFLLWASRRVWLGFSPCLFDLDQYNLKLPLAPFEGGPRYGIQNANFIPYTGRLPLMHIRLEAQYATNRGLINRAPWVRNDWVTGTYEFSSLWGTLREVWKYNEPVELRWAEPPKPSDHSWIAPDLKTLLENWVHQKRPAGDS